MRKSRLARRILVTAALLLCLSTPARAGFWSLFHLADEDSFNFRFTVVLYVDGQVLRASSVHELSASTEIRTIPGTGGGLFSKGRGEALRVVIPGKPSLYFLVADGGGNVGWYSAIVQDCGLNDDNRDPVARLKQFRSFSGPCELSRKSIPMAVRLLREGDPSSMKEVVLPETEGPDGAVRLLSATIERTTEPISAGIATHLPWLSSTELITIATHRGPLPTNISVFVRR